MYKHNKSLALPRACPIYTVYYCKTPNSCIFKTWQFDGKDLSVQYYFGTYILSDVYHTIYIYYCIKSSAARY